MNGALRSLWLEAKKEGRICTRCGWMVSKTRWKEGKRLCHDCQYGLSGVIVRNKYGRGPYRDEPVDKTGEML